MLKSHVISATSDVKLLIVAFEVNVKVVELMVPWSVGVHLDDFDVCLCSFAISKNGLT